MALDQPAADMLLELGNATLDRGLIDAERLGGGLHAARACERQKMPEIVPRKRAHGLSLQFCRPLSQSFDCPMSLPWPSLSEPSCLPGGSHEERSGSCPGACTRPLAQKAPAIAKSG